MVKTKTQLKINRINSKINNWIMDILCFPVNKLEKIIKFKIKRFKNFNKPNIYNYVTIGDLK